MRLFKHSLPLFMAIFIAVVGLTACGGGGGSSAVPPAIPSAPVSSNGVVTYANTNSVYLNNYSKVAYTAGKVIGIDQGVLTVRNGTTGAQTGDFTNVWVNGGYSTFEAFGFAYDQRYLYVLADVPFTLAGNSRSDLYVFDLTQNLINPTPVAVLPLNIGLATGLHKSGTNLFIIGSSNNALVDLTNVGTPTVLALLPKALGEGSFFVGNGSQSGIAGNYLVSPSGIYDISVPTNFSFVSSLSIPETEVQVQNGYVFAISGSLSTATEIAVYSIDVAGNPVRAATINGSMTYYQSIAVSGNYLVASGDFGTLATGRIDGFVLYDITNPAQPILIDSVRDSYSQSTTLVLTDGANILYSDNFSAAWGNVVGIGNAAGARASMRFTISTAPLTTLNVVGTWSYTGALSNCPGATDSGSLVIAYAAGAYDITINATSSIVYATCANGGGYSVVASNLVGNSPITEAESVSVLNAASVLTGAGITYSQVVFNSTSQMTVIGSVDSTGAQITQTLIRQ